MPCLREYRCPALASSSFGSGVPPFSVALPLPKVRQALLGLEPQSAYRDWRPRSGRMRHNGHSVHRGGVADAIRLAGTRRGDCKHPVVGRRGFRACSGLERNRSLIIRSRGAATLR